MGSSVSRSAESTAGQCPSRISPGFIRLIDLDHPSGRRSTYSDASDRFDLHLSSINNNETDLNESVSSKSNLGDGTDLSNLDSGHPMTNTRSTALTPAIPTTNTSRTSITTYPGQTTGRGLSGRLTSIMERRRSPDMLLKKWMKSQKLTTEDSDEPIALTVSCSASRETCSRTCD